MGGIISNIKVDFNEIDDRIIEILQNIINNLIKAHFEEKETILILQNLNITGVYLSLDEIFSLLKLITNCPILVILCNLYQEQKKLPEKDYEHELHEKDQIIQ